MNEFVLVESPRLIIDPRFGAVTVLARSSPRFTVSGPHIPEVSIQRIEPLEAIEGAISHILGGC